MFSSQTCCWCCCWLSCSKFFGDGLEVSVCTSFQQPRQLFLVLTGTQESANFQRFKHKLCRFSGTSLLSTSSHSRNPLCLQQRSWPPLTLLQTQPACIAWYPSLSALRRVLMEPHSAIHSHMPCRGQKSWHGVHWYITVMRHRSKLLLHCSYKGEKWRTPWQQYSIFP